MKERELEVYSRTNKVNLFSDYNYAQIKYSCQQGIADQCFHAGDTRDIVLGPLSIPSNGMEGSTQIDGQHATLTIIDIPQNKGKITCLVTSYNVQAPKVFMNPTTPENEKGYNIGGWKMSYMRAWLNKVFYGALPEDLRSIVVEHPTPYVDKNGGVSTCNDRVWLMGEKEVFNVQDFSNKATSPYESQFQYFADGGTKVFKTSLEGNPSNWWLRDVNNYNESNFCCVLFGKYSDINCAGKPLYVFPVFDIG